VESKKCNCQGGSSLNLKEKEMKYWIAKHLVRFAQWMLSRMTKCYEWSVLNEEAKRIERKIRKKELKVVTETVKNYKETP
jgi:hypothetical protein